MYFAGAIVDTESTHVGKDAHHWRIAGDAHAAHDLHAAVCHAPFSFRADDLRTTGFECTLLAFIEQPGGRLHGHG